MIGILASAKTSAGMGVGPGAIMNFFRIEDLIKPGRQGKGNSGNLLYFCSKTKTL